VSDDELLLLLKPALNRGELLLHREAQLLELRLAPVGRSQRFTQLLECRRLRHSTILLQAVLPMM
jgi:hypothetical protein